MITRHQHTAPVFTTRSPLILLTSCMYIRGVVTLVRGHAAEVTLVVVAVDGALRARVPLQAAVRGPPPGVALYLGDEDVPVLGEGGAGPGEGQRVARVLREVNLVILRFVCWFPSLPLISRSLFE